MPVDTDTPPAREELSESLRALLQRVVVETRNRLLAPQVFRATYRLQFSSRQFGFDDARAIVPYLADLGISHIYASPCTTAHSGSTHGYDVVDPTRINPELGGQPDFEALVHALHEHKLGVLLDIVPNHMSIADDENIWWMDVLTNGPASSFASFFDIDWNPVKPDLAGKVLLPVLGDLYGTVLESGQLQVAYRQGALSLQIGKSFLPLDPRTWGEVLGPNLEVLRTQLGAESPDQLEYESILAALQHLPERSETGPEQVAHRHRERIVIERRLQHLVDSSPAIEAHLTANLRLLNGEVGSPRSFDALDRLLEMQAYRLAHWKAGSDEMNYRRFFDVTELAAVCTENCDVFEATHRLVLELAEQGQANGVRIDHIDGLLDPLEYLRRLQRSYVRKACERAVDSLDTGDADRPRMVDELEAALQIPVERGAPLPLMVLVEKILGADEPLPVEWPANGTTGYDALNLIGGLYVDPRGLAALQRHYERFTDQAGDLEQIAYESKRLILSTAMQSEVQLLAHRLDRLSNRHRSSRDYTLHSLRSAIREIIACFPVYRTYIREGFVTERDRRVVMRAVALARRRNPATEASVFDFVRDVLLMVQPQELDEEGQRQRRLFVGRFQQVTSPVMAKGVEDTAFYRYLALSSLSEVGGEPRRPTRTVEEFHRQTAARIEEWPHSMIATTTHDTKRTEDVRARLSILSEIPGEWRKALSRWTRWNRRHRREVDGEPAPSRNDEWLFYQTLVGIWPLSPPPDEAFPTLILRIQKYLEKATREAKLRTSWVSPNTAYEEAVRDFVGRAMEDPHGRFCSDVQAFVDSIVDAGLFTSLSQSLLKLTLPGIPDIYQGQELWDFSLVDPDNRRPVDYDLRKNLLTELVTTVDSAEGRAALAQDLARNPRDMRTKLYVTWTALQFLRGWQRSAGPVQYIPLEASGERSHHLVAFLLQQQGGARAVVVCPRLLWSLMREAGGIPFGEQTWQRCTLTSPAELNGHYYNLLDGRRITLSGANVSVGELLRSFPMALLTTEAAADESLAQAGQD